jgi:hypothetical protein
MAWQGEFHVFFIHIYNKASNSLAVGNALAFDAKRLSAVNTTDLLTKVTKSVIINGFDFSPALEHALKHSPTLGRHTNVLHFSSDAVTHYIWAHKDYQPWGKTSPLQCPQCGILDPWKLTFVKQIDGYRLECKNPGCGVVDGRRVGKMWAFIVHRPQGCKLLPAGKQSNGGGSGWLKLSETQFESNFL